jgi:hypothetical protein
MNAPKPAKNTDAQLKAKLLALAKAGRPKPKANSELGCALAAFTAPPTRDQELLQELVRRVEADEPAPSPRSELGKYVARLKAELLALAKAGKPKPNTELGIALAIFTGV